MLHINFPRYLSIFHQAWLSSLDDSKVVNVSRVLVTALSLIIPWTVEMPEGVTFTFLTNQDPKAAQTGHTKYLRIFVLFELLFIIFAQVKIEMYNQSSVAIQNEEIDDDGQSFMYSKTTIRFVKALSTITLLGVTFWFFISRDNAEDIILSRLKVQLLIQLVALIIVPTTLISRNPNMSKYFKDHYKYLFLS